MKFINNILINFRDDCTENPSNFSFNDSAWVRGARSALTWLISAPFSQRNSGACPDVPVIVLLFENPIPISWNDKWTEKNVSSKSYEHYTGIFLTAFELSVVRGRISLNRKSQKQQQSIADMKGGRILSQQTRPPIEAA